MYVFSSLCMTRVAGYYRHHRQWRVMNELASLFDGCEWMIVHSPFVHSHGQSRSAALCDTDADMGDGDDANAVHHQQQQLNAAHQQHQILDGNASTNDSGGGTSGTPDLQPAEQTQHGSDPILAQGEGDGSQQLSPIENENMGDVNPNLPDKEGYTSVATREPEEEKVNEAHYSSASKMRLGGSHDLAASEDSSDHRHREEELSAKVRPKAKPLKLPKVCMYVCIRAYFCGFACPLSFLFRSVRRWYSSSQWKGRSSMLWYRIF